jgi:hypothetical protein
MGLDDIAAGLEVTTEQRDRGVPTVDRTDESLAERLVPVDDELPCDGSTAATIVERYAGGGSVGAAGRAAGVPPMTAAKTLHLLGESVWPLGEIARDVVRDWLAGDLSRTEALDLARASEREFALAVYVETHDPLPAARDAVADALAVDRDVDPLADTHSETTDLL